MRKPLIGVMGPGDPSKEISTLAYQLGAAIGKNKWNLVNGGRNAGVMDAVSKGAHDAGGFVIGVLPSENTDTASKYVDVAIVTDMGDARNSINVLSSDVVVVCGMNPGTASEVALAIKAKKPVILLKNSKKSVAFFQELSENACIVCETVPDSISYIKQLLK